MDPLNFESTLPLVRDLSGKVKLKQNEQKLNITLTHTNILSFLYGHNLLMSKKSNIYNICNQEVLFPMLAGIWPTLRASVVAFLEHVSPLNESVCVHVYHRCILSTFYCRG